MMRRLMRLAGVLLVMAALATPGQAAFIVDFSPATFGGATVTPGSNSWWQNQSTLDNFAESILFSSDATVTGMDIYSSSLNPVLSVGTQVTIRLWSDNAGAPGSLLTSFTEVITTIDGDGVGSATNAVRVRADFTSALELQANTRYWIGMSGTTSNIGLKGLSGVNAPDDSRMAWFNGSTLNSVAPTGDMAFRLEGSLESAANPIPAPPGAVLGVIGVFGLFGIRLVRRRATSESVAA
jgi:hypothetical protein